MMLIKMFLKRLTLRLVGRASGKVGTDGGCTLHSQVAPCFSIYKIDRYNMQHKTSSSSAAGCIGCFSIYNKDNIIIMISSANIGFKIYKTLTMKNVMCDIIVC